ncbi:hypothetical protein BD560DRAFT_426186 [Blakeslea trispora]|nr:hypothetical protein BD560DRAFT_426186 [Blakeslea trispora]
MNFQVIINSFAGFGPVCLCFKYNEPCTVYDLKKKLSVTTAFSVEEQRIRTLGGKILTDSDNLLQNYRIHDGPIVLNLTVRLIGGRMQRDTTEPILTDQQRQTRPLSKKIRLEGASDILIHHSTANEDMPQQMDKGKGKQTYKRKI